MNERTSKTHSGIMFIMTCIFGLLYLLLTVSVAYPAYTVKLPLLDSSAIGKAAAFAELLAAVAPIAFALVAYVLNFAGSAEIGCLFGLGMLVLNILNCGELSSLSVILRFLTNIAFSFLVIGYSVSDGKYRTHVGWVLVTFALCVVRACDMFVAMSALPLRAAFEGMLGITCILTHLCAILGLIPNISKQLSQLPAERRKKIAKVKAQRHTSTKKAAARSSSRSIDTYKKQKM